MYDWHSIVEGFAGILQWKPLILMTGAVILSSIFAALPGIGSHTLLAMAIPFAMTLKPYECIALLLGINAISNTANSFPSILIAIPGGAGSQATIVDGNPMAKKGEANRAFGAAYMSSLLGGLIGGVVFMLALPLVTPLVLLLGSPELMMLVLWGMSSVAILSGTTPVKGLMAAALGLGISLIGTEHRTGIERFTFGDYYLWDGIHIAIVGLGMFGVPELIDLAVRRSAISQTGELGSGLWQGVKDTFKNWWLVIRCAMVGIWVGILPGLGSSVADWFAYAHAVQTEKNTENFGKGDVRGVIAPESSNNAKEGGALIPTMFFGIPGSSSMALILVAFGAIGIAPGEPMITQNKHLIFAMIAVLVFANVMATVLSMGLANTFAKVSIMPFYIVVPMTLIFTIAAAYGIHFTYADLVALIGMSFVGFFMRRYGWPRPPVLVAVVLGPQLETYLWLSVDRYGLHWMMFPGVMAIGLIILATVFWPMWKHRKRQKVTMDYYLDEDRPKMQSKGGMVFTLLFLGVMVYGAVSALKWPPRASLDVYFVCGIGILLAVLQLSLDAVRYLRDPGAAVAPVTSGKVTRYYFEAAGWIAGILALIVLVGFHVAFLVVPIAYARIYGAGWRTAITLGVLAEGVLIGLFDTIINVVWPVPLLVPDIYVWVDSLF